LITAPAVALGLWKSRVQALDLRNKEKP